MLTRLGKRAGVLPGRDLTPHVLRASRLTHMHDDGVPIDEIREYADHEDIATALGYIRRRDEAKRRARHAASGAAAIAAQLQRWNPAGG
jgi:integrase